MCKLINIFLVKLFDWAVANREKLYLRTATFYRIANQLAEKLQIVFASFAAPFILNNCIQELDFYHALKGHDATSHDVNIANAILINVLETLSKSFLHDVNGLFASKERVQFATDAVVDQVILVLLFKKID